MIQLKAAEILKIQQHRVTHINTIRLCNTPNLKKEKSLIQQLVIIDSSTRSRFCMGFLCGRQKAAE